MEGQKIYLDGGLESAVLVADESSKEIAIAYSLPEESQLWAVGYILGRFPRLQGTPPNPRSVTALCKYTEEGVASHKGVVSYKVLCAGGNSTGESSFREDMVAVLEAPQEGEMEIGVRIVLLFVSSLLW